MITNTQNKDVCDVMSIRVALLLLELYLNEKSSNTIGFYLWYRKCFDSFSDEIYTLGTEKLVLDVEMQNRSSLK
jgi:hypothetical protein